MLFNKRETSALQTSIALLESTLKTGTGQSLDEICERCGTHPEDLHAVSLSLLKVKIGGGLEDIPPTTETLINAVYAEIRSDLIKVTTCADTVRVERNDLPNVFMQKNATEPSSLWKVYIGGSYILGMETLHDGFVFARHSLKGDAWEIDWRSTCQSASATANRGCGLSYELYAQRLSCAIDEMLELHPAERRTRAIEIAKEWDYSLPEERVELEQDGCCSHGIELGCCPAGCGS